MSPHSFILDKLVIFPHVVLDVALHPSVVAGQQLGEEADCLMGHRARPDLSNTKLVEWFIVIVVHRVRV